MDLYGINAQQLGEGARIPLACLGESEKVFEALVREMVQTIEANNAHGRRSVLILPVGPVGQYPVFVQMVNERQLSLKHCWFANMDEYLQADGQYLPAEHRLSFRGFMQRQVYGQIDPQLLPPEAQRLFPDPADPEALDRKIEELGGVDLALGGIGINGHLAFNEPQPELSPEAFLALPTRVLTISPETRVANAIGDLGGALERMPELCVTIGMRQIFSARRIRLGVFRDWHRAVVRRAAYGEASASFPVSLLQRHADAMIYVNSCAAQQPY